MTAETKTCQNCKQPFTIEPDDFAFYKKVQVPPPTWCPECRRQRRFAFRNEWSLYKRMCDLCKKGFIAMYPVSAPFPVYCRDCWFSDKWDATTYGRQYDFSRPFFVQMGELFNAVPRLGIFQRNSINSEFTNMAGESKNVYLSCSVVVGSENVFYSKFVDKSFNIVDSLSVVNSDHCYENRNVDRNYNAVFAVLSRNCIDCRYVYDCVNCRNCVLSSNLRNKQYVIRNASYTKDEYFKEIERIQFGSRATAEEYGQEFSAIIKNALHKYADVTKVVDSGGDHLANTKNAKHCFEVYDAEDCKYCYRFLVAKQCYDADYGGPNVELIYEYNTAAMNASRVRFSISALDAVSDVHYTDYCTLTSKSFGCSGLRSKSHCILNKQYAEQEYDELLPRIQKHMGDMPYVDKAGATYTYGEFFPPEISPFSYNETLAQELYPMSEADVAHRGWRWAAAEQRDYPITKNVADLPDSIDDTPDSIINENIGCSHRGLCGHHCTKAFRVVAEELQFYKKMQIPLPGLCPSCRYFERFTTQNPLKLWHRRCQCLSDDSLSRGGSYRNNTSHAHKDKPCPNEFETPYAPDRPEIVYCEQCYQAEVT
jgi:hypothetical protein